MTVFSMKRLFVEEINQQGIVNWTMLLTDIGLAALLVALALFMVWRLYDLFLKNGRWAEELQTERKKNAKLELKEQQQKMEELKAVLEEESK